MQQVKGTVLKSRLAFVQDHFGAEGLEKLLASLSQADRDALRMVLPITWYPFDLGKRLDDAIVQVLAGGDQSFFERLGAESAQKNLTTFHKAFLTPGDPHAFLGKAGTIYGLYYEKGRREYEKTGEREGVLRTYDAETFSAPDCLTIVGWHRHALEMCGVKNPRVVEEECRASGGAMCRYRLSWQ